MFWLCTPTRAYSHTNTQEQKNPPLTLSPDWVKCCFDNQHQRPKKAANAVENHFFWFWDIRQSRQVKTGETNKACKTKADAARLSAMWHIRSSEWTWLCVKEVGYPKKHVWSSFSIFSNCILGYFTSLLGHQILGNSIWIEELETRRCTLAHWLSHDFAVRYQMLFGSINPFSLLLKFP